MVLIFNCFSKFILFLICSILHFNWHLGIGYIKYAFYKLFYFILFGLIH